MVGQEWVNSGPIVGQNAGGCQDGVNGFSIVGQSWVNCGSMVGQCWVNSGSIAGAA